MRSRNKFSQKRSGFHFIPVHSSRIVAGRSTGSANLRLIILFLLITAVLVWTMFNGHSPLHTAPIKSESGGVQQAYSIRKGNINGFPIAVPVNYMMFPFEYRDKSIWEPQKPGDKPYSERGFEDALIAFSLYVQWPDLKPRSSETEASFRDSRDGKGEHNWLLIGVLANKPQEIGQDKGWGILLEHIIQRTEGRPQKRLLPPRNDKEWSGGEEEVEIRYSMRGMNQYDLNWAEPTGIGTDQFETWNKVLLWHGDREKFITDLIECQNGKLRNSNHFLKCRHRYRLPEWGAEVAVTYPRSMLPLWRELKVKTKNLILSFQAENMPESSTD